MNTEIYIKVPLRCKFLYSNSPLKDQCMYTFISLRVQILLVHYSKSRNDMFLLH